MLSIDISVVCAFDVLLSPSLIRALCRCEIESGLSLEFPSQAFVLREQIAYDNLQIRHAVLQICSFSVEFHLGRFSRHKELRVLSYPSCVEPDWPSINLRYRTPIVSLSSS